MWELFYLPLSLLHGGPTGNKVLAAEKATGEMVNRGLPEPTSLPILDTKCFLFSSTVAGAPAAWN
jgi:hypothetical protein